ncbi:MAG: response regulator, partial [Nitrososphaeraceae archaeon]
MVDDNIDHLTIFQEGLERYGFSVKGYFSPLKALEEFHPGIYDVAIVNVMTHAMNGKDLFKGNKEINTVTSNHFWNIRKPITIENLLEEVV